MRDVLWLFRLRIPFDEGSVPNVKRANQRTLSQLILSDSDDDFIPAKVRIRVSVKGKGVDERSPKSVSKSGAVSTEQSRLKDNISKTPARKRLSFLAIDDNVDKHVTDDLFVERDCASILTFVLI